MIDYHIHTAFSEDSDMDMDMAVTTAIQRNLSEIAITDHMDHDYQSPDITFELDTVKYFQTLEEVKERYSSKIRIVKGVELGLQPHILDWCREFTAQNSFDFIIGSIHTVQKQDLYSQFTRGKSKTQCYAEYLSDMYTCVKGFDDFSVLGHFDVIRRYIEDPDKSFPLGDYLDITEEIFKLLIHKGKGIEINTSGLRYSLDSTSPPLEFIQRFKDLGGEIITIGSDAHAPEQIGLGLDIALEMAKSAGFKYVATFSKGIPQFNKIA